MKKCLKININIQSGISYKISFPRNVFTSAPEGINNIFGSRSKFLVTDENVGEIYKNEINGFASAINAKIYSLPVGELNKNWQISEMLIDWLFENDADRDSLLVTFGGGVVTDLAGFAASIYKRGIGTVLIPTSIIAQADSAIGGKTGINSRHSKNALGTFHHPQAVFVDTALLKSLPERDFVSGLAEVVKYGIMCDRNLFEFLEKNADRIIRRDWAIITDIIYRCCEIKSSLVQEDPYDRSRRRLLNFGHTFGHALESFTQNSVNHGEAVAWGMQCASALSNDLGLLSAQSLQRQTALLSALNLISENMPAMDPSAIVNYMITDKKNRGENITIVLPNEIGEGSIYSNINKELISKSILTGTDNFARSII